MLLTAVRLNWPRLGLRAIGLSQCRSLADTAVLRHLNVKEGNGPLAHKMRLRIKNFVKSGGVVYGMFLSVRGRDSQAFPDTAKVSASALVCP